MGLERLDKLIAAQGGRSRRDVKELAARGRILVDGKVEREMSRKVDPDVAQIAVDGVEIALKKHLYLLLNKPTGYVSSTEDRDGPSVLELVPPQLMRRGLFPAGRLDKDTTGLMIITDDGQLAHRILAPRRHVKKRYRVTLDGPVTAEMVSRFAEGIELSEGMCKPAELIIESEFVAMVTLTEGRYHQIKRMFACFGVSVTALHRVAMGNLQLPDDLPPGELRELTEDEWMALQELV